MKRLCLFFLWVWANHSVAAGFGIDQTRVVIHQGDKAVNVSMHNTLTSTPFLVQSWVSANKKNNQAGPFQVTPPITRLEAGGNAVVKVMPLAGIAALPRDRESLFYFIARAIPSYSPLARAPAERETNGSIRTTISIMLKLFYRPAGLPTSQGSAFAGLRFERQPGIIVAKNNSPYYVVLGTLNFGDQAVKLVLNENDMLAPFGEQRYAASSQATTVAWSALNDDGIPQSFNGVIH